ncbi:uncharacterized protein NECHADRAFT_9978, partial [Fusarium vanettenii 77-13-4]
CNACRSRKIKCDRRRPSCTFCIKNAFRCEYIKRDRTPGLRAGYVSQLEQRI